MQLFANPMGALKSQSLVSCVPVEEQSRLVSQIGFRLVSIPALMVERERERWSDISALSQNLPE